MIAEGILDEGQETVIHRPLTRGEKIIAFIEKYCRVPEGALVGKPLLLLDFQKKFILDVFDNPAGTTHGYLSIARKNGKTALIACLVLAFLVGPEQQLNAQIVSGARSKDQAAIVFNLATKMVNLNPALAALVRVAPSGKRMVGLRSNTEYRALAAEGTTNHGLSPLFAILDEVGQVKGPQDDFIDAVVTAQGAHASPILIAISTQAPTDTDLFSIWLDDAERSGDPKIVSHVYSAPKELALNDPKAWAAANPALGVFRSRDDIAQQAARAMRMPTEENTFRVLGLNQRVSLHAPFISPSTWKENSGEVDFDAFYQGHVYGGLDLSRTTDLTSLVLVVRKGDLWHVQSHFWSPLDTLMDRAKRDRAPYELWKEQGFLNCPPGTALKYNFIAADIARITQGMNLAIIRFDRALMQNLTVELERQEITLPLEECGQGYLSQSPLVKATEIEFLNKTVRTGNHPVLNMCAANAIVVKDPAENMKLDKNKSTGRIDGVVAMVMALGTAIQREAGAPSVYETRGLRMI